MKAKKYFQNGTVANFNAYFLNEGLLSTKLITRTSHYHPQKQFCHELFYWDQLILGCPKIKQQYMNKNENSTNKKYDNNKQFAKMIMTCFCNILKITSSNSLLHDFIVPDRT